MEIDLPEHIFTIITEIAEKFPEIEQVTVFGSRVLGNAKQGSDIDLAVIGKMVTSHVMSAFQDYLEEKTNIPYLFDILHFDSTTNDALREHITRYGKSLYVKRASGKDV